MTRTAVLHLDMPLADGESVSLRSQQARLEEAVNLADALALDVAYSEIISVKRINPKTVIGGGKIEELLPLFEAEDVQLIIINGFLSPTQQRNLEVAWQRKVIDRTHLILEIFADRARTKAGRLQVELAHCMYQQSRLVRSWTHLERQRGGIGKMGGPGERQIEIDRRLIKDRMTQIRKQLKSVEKERELHRKTRKKSRISVVALVGYTNAGKSTLFNALVGDHAEAKDMLFATLDPLMRRIELPNGQPAILSDTVGFVSDLPHELVEAFSATLEEVASADLLLQVHDASSPDADAQAEDVAKVLRDIGADEIPVLHVANKMDLVSHTPPGVPLDACEVSAQNGSGIEELKLEIAERLFGAERLTTVYVPASEGKWLAWLHAHGNVVHSELDGEMWQMHVELNSLAIDVLRQEAPDIAFHTGKNKAS